MSSLFFSYLQAAHRGAASLARGRLIPTAFQTLDCTHTHRSSTKTAHIMRYLPLYRSMWGVSPNQHCVLGHMTGEDEVYVRICGAYDAAICGDESVKMRDKTHMQAFIAVCKCWGDRGCGGYTHQTTHASYYRR